MRTSTLVAFFALLAVALAASIEEKAVDKSAYSSNKASAAESDESYKATDGVNSYEKSASSKEAAASSRAGGAENKNYNYVDEYGNLVSASSSKKEAVASDSAQSSSASYESSVAA